MILDERLQRIKQYMEEEKTATLSQLASLNGVSVDTVRRDLSRLEELSFLRRVRGGAVLNDAEIDRTFEADDQSMDRQKEKQAIATRLEPFIMDGQSIVLGGGTTCTEVAAFLVKHYVHLTILTNNLKALDVLADASGFTILVPGGILDTDADELFGQQCEEDILKYNFDLAILGCYAVSLEKGITDDRFYQKGILQAMAQSSRIKVLVADATKFGKVAPVNICPLNQFDIVISDHSLPQFMIQEIEAYGAKVVV